MGKISKKFKRLAILALGFSIALAGVLGIVHFNSGGNIQQEYAYANLNTRSLSVNASGVVSWDVSISGGASLYIRSVRVVANGSIVGTPAIDLEIRNNRNSIGVRHQGTFQLPIANLRMGENQITLRVEWGRIEMDNVTQMNAWWNITSRETQIVTFTRTSTLDTPTNVRMDSNTLRWNSVGDANGYRVYRDNVHISNPGNVTSLNLVGLGVAGTMHTFSVSATSMASYWHTSARGGSVQWGQLSAPVVSVSGTTLSWGAVGSATGYRIYRDGTHIYTLGVVTSFNVLGHIAGGGAHSFTVRAVSTDARWADSASVSNLAAPANVVANEHILNWSGVTNATYYRIYSGNVFAVQVAHAGAGMVGQAFNLANWAENYDRYGSIISTGINSIKVVAIAPGFPNSVNSVATNFTRAAAVHSISLGMPDGVVGLQITYPVPPASQRASAQLVVDVVRVSGSDSHLYWSTSCNGTILTVSSGGYVRAVAVDRGHSDTVIVTARARVRNTANQEVSQEIAIYVIQQPYAGPIVRGIAVTGDHTSVMEIANNGALPPARQLGVQLIAVNDPNTAVTWSIRSGANYVSIAQSGQNVTINAIRAGQAVLRVTSVQTPSQWEEVTIRVTQNNTPQATSVTVRGPNNAVGTTALPHPIQIVHNFVAGATTLQLSASVTGHFSPAQTVSWSSSNTGVVQVNNAGLVSIRAAGVATVTATSTVTPSVTGTFVISVMQDSPPPSVSGVGAIGRTASELVIPLPATTQTLYVHTSVLGAHGGQNTGIVWETSDAARATVTEVSFVGGVSTARVTAVSGSAAGLAVTITARSVLNNAFHNSTNITIFQAGLAGINVSLVGGATAGSLTIPYAVADINARPTLTLIATFDLSAAAHSASISRDVTWVATPSNLVQIDAQSTPGAADRRATIRPLAAGVVTITAVGAHCGTISAVFTMEVVQAQPTSIRILGPGEREFYYETTIVLPRPDHLLLPFIQLAANSATGARAVVWSTNCGGAVLERLASSEQVAEVIASFRGIGAGVALVTAYHPASGHSATFSIIVNKADILGVELSAPNNATSASLFVPIVSVGSGEYGLPALYSREYIVLSANVMVQFGATSGVEWSIDNPYAARIVGSRFGTSVTIMAVNGSVGGEAVRVTVRATNPSANGAFKEATFDIVVIQAAVANISIGGATTSMVIPYNATAQHAMPYIMLSAGIDTHHMAPRTLSFASSCGGSVISIDTRETTFTSVIEVSVWAVAAGTSTVTVRSLADASQYATIIISVSKQGVSSVSIAPPPASSMVIVYPTPEAGRRGSIQLSAEVVTSYGAPEAVVWTSSDSTIASVDANGLVRAVRGSLEGLSVTITAASAIDGGLFDSVTLTIYQAGETYLSIVGPNANSAQYVMFIPWGDVADAVQLGFALCTILGGSLDAVLSWQSSREDVASVSESGLVMAHSAGQATIRLVSDSGSSAVFTIVVVEMSEPPTIHYIYITDADGNKGAAELELPYVLPSLNLMPTILLSANVGASNTAIEGGLTGVIWHICQSSYALAELLGSNGFVRILYHGTITIIATSTLNNQIYGTFTFTVTRAAPPQDNNGDNGNGGNGGDKPNENKLPEGYVRLILVCENYFGQARMEHIDMTLEQALEFVLPVLTLNIQGAIFLGWSLSRNGEILPSVMLVSVAGYENGAGYVTLLPAHMFDLEAGLDTLLLFAVWYLPADDDSNLGRNILLGAYIIVGVGAATAGIAGYIVQSKIKRRRKGEMSEWGMDN